MCVWVYLGKFFWGLEKRERENASHCACVCACVLYQSRVLKCNVEPIVHDSGSHVHFPMHIFCALLCSNSNWLHLSGQMFGVGFQYNNKINFNNFLFYSFWKSHRKSLCAGFPEKCPSSYHLFLNEQFKFKFACNYFRKSHRFTVVFDILKWFFFHLSSVKHVVSLNVRMCAFGIVLDRHAYGLCNASLLLLVLLFASGKKENFEHRIQPMSIEQHWWRKKKVPEVFQEKETQTNRARTHNAMAHP